MCACVPYSVAMLAWMRAQGYPSDAFASWLESHCPGAAPDAKPWPDPDREGRDLNARLREIR